MLPMFGEEAKLAVLTAVNPAPVAGEEAALQSLRRKLGPYANQDKLVFHIRTARGKVHWAVNSYFRDVLCEANNGIVADFRHKRSTGHLPQAVTLFAATASGASCEAITAAPICDIPGVLEQILTHLDFTDVCQASSVCKAFYQAAQSHTVWEVLSKRRWGGAVYPLDSCASCTSSGISTLASASQQYGCHSYIQQHRFEQEMRCPRCGLAKIVPIVYGYPSPHLLLGMRSKRLMLGGDHLVDDCHVWTCTCCAASFRWFPFGNLELWIKDDTALSQPTSEGAKLKYTFEL